MKTVYIDHAKCTRALCEVLDLPVERVRKLEITADHNGVVVVATMFPPLEPEESEIKPR